MTAAPQTAGIVTDVGLFLHQLSVQLGDARAPRPVPAAALEGEDR